MFLRIIAEENWLISRSFVGQKTASKDTEKEWQICFEKGEDSGRSAAISQTSRPFEETREELKTRKITQHRNDESL